MKKNIKKLLKSKTFIIFMILFIIFIILMIMLGGIFLPGGGSNYGNRLNGIKNIKFTDKDKTKITKELEKNDKVSSSKLVIHGKIINVTYNVNKDVSVEDARKIAEESLGNFSDKVKGFYDIQFIITKSEEQGEEVQVNNEDGNTTTQINKIFQIMGYKNSNIYHIVW